MKKEYLSPLSISTEIHIENAILSMSIGGEVDGPAGSSHMNEEDGEWEEQSNDSWY